MPLYLVVAAACTPTPDALVDQLSRELGTHPGLSARVSIASDALQCAVPSLASRLRRRKCEPPPADPPRSTRLARITRRAIVAAEGEFGSDAQHATALIDLVWGGRARASLDRSIVALEQAWRSSSHPAPILADLSAAYLERAEALNTPRDVLAALEAAERALRHDSTHTAARFNSALALQRVGLVEEASLAWRVYLALDSTSVWAHRSRGHLAEAQSTEKVPEQLPGDAPPAALARYAAADPQGARILGWCQVLGAWGEAVIRNDPQKAAAHLRGADTLAAALARRSGGDATLLDAVHAIHAARSAARRSQLAGAHRAFAAGCAHRAAVRFREARTQFDAAAAGAAGSPVLRAWAHLLHGRMTFHMGGVDAGAQRAREVAARTNFVRHPALAGEADQLMSVVMLRAYRHADVLVFATRGRERFRAAGERLNEGVMLDVASNASFHLGDVDEAHALAALALRQLTPYRNSYRLHNLLSYTAELIAEDGFPLAAIRMQDEGVWVAERTGNPTYIVEARLTRAKLVAAAGMPRSITADLQRAGTLLPSVHDPDVHGWMQAQLRLARATEEAERRPGPSAAALDSATEFYLSTMNAPLLALPGLVQAARARVRAHQPELALARLDAALQLLEKRRDTVRMELRRAAMFEDAWDLVEWGTMRKLAQGDTVTALSFLDRGLASLAPAGPSRPRPAFATGRRAEVILRYALIGDTLLAWTGHGAAFQMHRSLVDATRVSRTVERVIGRMEASASETELRGDLAQLYDWLLGPLRARMEQPGTRLVVVAGGDLGMVPFAALFDARSQRYLIEDHPVRMAVNLTEAMHPPRRVHHDQPVLVVADPAFRVEAHPGLSRLTGAAEEAWRVADMYSRVQVLPGPEAHRNSVRRALSQAVVIHYAGHAVFDDARPERSFLLLAPATTAGTDDRLEAREIARLDLRHTELVVLSACETVRAGHGRGAGFSGLAAAFLAAGAGGAVGSLWSVDDALTRPLMLAFHRAYRVSGDAAAALQTAQIEMLRSPTPFSRSPAVWAGFRYTGI